MEKEDYLPRTGMKTMDRGLLVFIWMMAVLYGMMCEQMVGRTTSQSCELRQGLDNAYGQVSVATVLVVPTITGPLSVLAVYTVIRLSRGQETEQDPEDREDSRCTACLTVIFLVIYTNTMVLCELWDFTKDNTFVLVLGMTSVCLPIAPSYIVIIFTVKYIIGSCQNLLAPAAILLSKSGVWEMTKKV